MGLSAVTKRSAAVTIIVIVVVVEAKVFTAVFVIINLDPKEGIIFSGKIGVIVMEVFIN